MKKYLFYGLFMFSCLSLQAQLFTEDFDGSNTTATTTTTGCGVGNSGDYFGIVDETDINQDYTSDTGSFLGAQDTDGASCTGTSAGSVSASIVGVDIVGETGLILCFDIAEGSSSDGAEDWDASSNVTIGVVLDGGAQVDLVSVEAAGGTNTAPGFDCSGDGAADGPAVTETFTTYCVNIPGTGAVLDINIAISGLDAGDEDVALDNFQVFSDSSVGASGTDPCPVTCTISDVIATATCNGDDADVTITYTAANTSGTHEVDVDGGGFITLASGGIYTLTGPTTAAAGVTVTVRDATDSACMQMTTVDIPECPENLCPTAPMACAANFATTTFATPVVDGTAQEDVDALDDNWIIGLESDNCGPNEKFEIVYGVMAPGAGVGEITGLVLADGSVYPSTVTFTLNEVTQDCSCTGEMGTDTGSTDSQTFSTATGSMQGNSPKPSGIGTHYSENTGSATNPNIICINFPSAVPDVSFWIGDVESSEVNPGKIYTYDNTGCLMSTDQIPTSTPIASQGTDCTGSTGGAGFDGCGNDESNFVSISATSAIISTICIEVGDFPDDDSNPGGSEHISFGGVSLGGQCVPIVPVELTQFSAEAKRDYTLIEWSTASEVNNSHFEVQWSDDGTVFKTIGEVLGNGNSAAENLYTYEHTAPMSLNYYRLKQVDYDGRYEYSEIRQVRFDDIDGVIIRPTVTSDKVIIEYNNSIKANIVVYDLHGRTIMSDQIVTGQELDLSSYTQGTYIFRISIGDKVIIKKVIKS